ncbi:MAG: histidine kinase [Lachnospiraceae bacterium]|jgi:sensor histidine kinase YesM|uniref:sensor histidine kinase n=1 Tax=Candidatus Merdisoma sp. JLR.KK006 TaxID=3112626 RepID=UPI002FEE6EEF|nr:histidine kinase [Lachnospiraceae bacterium]
MNEAKLQKKTILLALQIYTIVFAASILLSYVFIISPLWDQAVVNYNTQNEYILDEVDAALNTVKEYANYIAYSEDIMKKMNAYLQTPSDAAVRFDLETVLYNTKNLKQGIEAVVLEMEGGDRVTSILDLAKEEEELLVSDWYARIRENSYSGGFSKGISIVKNSVPVKLIAYSKSYRMKNRKFTLTVFVRYEDLLGRIMRHYHDEFEEQYWSMRDGEALFEGEQAGLDKLIGFGKNSDPIQKSLKGVLFIQSLDNASYRSISFVSTRNIFYAIKEPVLLILLMSVVLLISTLLIVVYIVKRVTKPVHQLAKAMERVAAKDFAVKLPMESDDEIGYLSQTFNHLSEELQNYIEKIVKSIETEQEMKYGLLISQIDPHFCCNTLNTIKYLAKQGRMKDVEIVAVALSNILRDRLRVKNFQIYDTVAQETNMVKKYLTIQEYHYGGDVEVHWFLEEGVKDLKIPKNIIQPLVENALVHGLVDEDDGSIKGILTIRVEKTDALYISVADNGCGMSREQIEEIMNGTVKAKQSGHGIGIDNIKERLEILYGAQARFSIYSELGKGTEMEIIIQ